MNNDTVNFTIIGINIPKSEIYINLWYKNWKVVSSQPDPDIMRAVIL